MELVLLALIVLAVGLLLRRKPGLLRGSVGVEPQTAPSFRHVTGTVTGLSQYAKDDADHTTEVSPDGTLTQKTYHNTTIVQSLFILSEDGLQTPLKLWGLEIPLADGQSVTVSYGDFLEKSRPIYLRNHSSGRTYPIFRTPLDLALDLGVVPGGFAIMLMAFAVCVALAIFGGLLPGGAVWVIFAVVLFPVIILVMVLRRRTRMTAFRTLLSSEEAAVSATRRAPGARA